MTSLSTPDEAKTPESTGLSGFHFHIDENPVSGPVGPHLFRLSRHSSDAKEYLDTHLASQATPTSTADPFYRYASKLGPERKDTPLPEKISKQTDQLMRSNIEPTFLPDVDRVASWTPQDVVMWMQKLGLDESIAEKFFINDISGSILLELQAEDLKELGIQSFGKRHRLLSSIQHLRDGTAIPPQPPRSQSSSVQPEPLSREPTPQRAMADFGTTESEIPTSDEESRFPMTGERGRPRHQEQFHHNTVAPENSMSIVAIEQLLPKVHTCSKGEDCRKWRKQQAKLARVAKDFPSDEIGSGGPIFKGDPGNATTAQSLVKTPNSDTVPSLTASSDVLGPNQSTEPYLSEEKLNVVQPRDPQENVRNFLNFQCMGRLQPANDPATPPGEISLSPQEESPSSEKANANLTENLRHLPRLRIPSAHAPVRTSTQSPNYSAQRTITPSIMRSATPLAGKAAYAAENMRNASTSGQSPGSFYRQDPHYEQSTPSSEMDVPVTAVPLGPVERDVSQSVPPDMRFGDHGLRKVDPIARPASTKAGNHFGNVPSHNKRSQPLRRLDESEALRPIETPEDYERTPRLGQCRNNSFGQTGQQANDATHSGWMKKRKATRFLRHEWEENHFALRGTRLAMYPDEVSSSRDSKALEHIDVDDYAVACSSLSSNSKLSAAFKKTGLKRKDNGIGDTAFGFSLVPSTNGSSGVDRKLLFSHGPKSHQFAVKTRDERIDWMRELMLAKALKKGRESGASVNINGSFL